MARTALRKIRRTASHTLVVPVLPAAIADLRALFDWRCSVSAADTAYALVRGDGECTASLSYAQLAQQVRTLAAAIAARSEPGDRVLLMLPTGLEWVCAFWACVISGRIAVPVAESRAARGGGDVLGAIVDDAAPRLVLTLPETRLPVRGERRWRSASMWFWAIHPRPTRRTPRSAPRSSPTCSTPPAPPARHAA